MLSWTGCSYRKKTLADSSSLGAEVLQRVQKVCEKATYLLLGCLEVFRSLEEEETSELHSLLFSLCLECL